MNRTNRPRVARLCTTVLLALALPACATQEEGLVGKPPPKEQVQERNFVDRISLAKPGEKERPKTEPEPDLLIGGWPFQDGNTTFRLTWKGGQQPVVLYEEPSLNAPKLGEAVWNPGEEVITRGSVVAVFQPSTYRAKAPTRIEGYLYDPGSYRAGNASVSYDIAAGETVEVYHYKESGICYMGVRSRMVEANCPREDEWSGNFKGKLPAEKLGPVSRIWWVQITTPQLSGWFEVDDRFLVDIESL